MALARVNWNRASTALELPVLLCKLLAYISLCMIANTFAEDISVRGETIALQKVLAKLEAARPEFHYIILGESDISGYLRIAIENGPILYVAEDGSHFFDGSVYRVEANGFVDVEELRLASNRRQIFAELDVDDMIVFAPAGGTKAIINVFTDIDCGYCRKLHNEVEELNSYGIEVRYLAYPRAGLDSPSYYKITTAWCSDDRPDTLTRLKAGKTLPNKNCIDNPVAAHLRLGREIGVDGTPAIIMMDGTMVPGYRSAADFAILLGLKNSG
ncbi:MAG: protein-disulfide isomerase [Porticoccaceae bacterium]|nr:protein-disulfide isomerase [Porticoccaceae bacterium]|tara:strand:+ start:75 stop:887 length:813 start_codon:yes stop_codon:yes gene_type:complete